MSGENSEYREGSLEAPTRHDIEWRSQEYFEEADFAQELERVFDICAGCRRCVSLCNAFPTLFDLIDESPTLEVDGVDQEDFPKVIDQCYLCDLCYMTKCPYVPPHEWNVDFPHLMLRGKALKFKKSGASIRDRLLTSTDAIGKLVSIPVVTDIVNSANDSKMMRKTVQSAFGIHPSAPLPRFHSDTVRKRLTGSKPIISGEVDRIGLFVTCYGNRNAPHLVEDMISIFDHNEVAVELFCNERCCGMPKFELGDFSSVERLKDANVPLLAELACQGIRLTAPVPSCVLMYRQELPLMFPDDEGVRIVSNAFVDPFEFLMKRHQDGKLKTQFKSGLGKVAYHAPCHQRVQNIGLKTKQILELVPDTEVIVLERCTGHDGTYAIKQENFEFAQKICRPVVNRIREEDVDYYVSDCPLAGGLIQHNLGDDKLAASVFELLKRAYGL